MDEASESMTADLRREVRRKKILESAKTRLEKLNGKAPTHGKEFWIIYSTLGKRFKVFKTAWLVLIL